MPEETKKKGPLQKLKDLMEEREDKYNQADLAIEVAADMAQNMCSTLCFASHASLHST